MKSVFALAILAASLVAATPATPANDWSKPCFDGECAYDLAGTENTGSGTFKIAGSPQAIADITPAAGWVILECDPHRLSQEIKLVCRGDDEAGCSRLFEHGAEQKVVRLPESCGAGPFARIASASVAVDQTIPGHVQLTRRDGVNAQVHVLIVDDRWDLADISKTGAVTFSLMAHTMPGPVGVMNYHDFTARDVDLARRSTDGIDGWSDFFTKAVASLKKAVQDLKDGLADKTKVEVGLEKVKMTYESGGSKKFDLLPKKEIDCKWGKASVAADITAKYKITAHVGAAITGSIIPPQVKEIATLAGFDGQADVHLHISAKAEVKGDVTWPILPKVNPTMVEIPGVISLGPHVEVNAKAEAGIKLTGDIDVGADFAIKDVEFWYPDKKVEPDVHDIKETPNPLKLNADVSVKGSLTASMHIVPKISVGINGLAGQVAAEAYVSMDGYISAEVKGEGSAGVKSRRSHARDLEARDAGFSGSVDVKAGVKIKGGLSGKILNIVEKDLSIDIWSTTWDIYKKSWASGKEKREFTPISDSPLFARDVLAIDAAGPLACPAIAPSFFSIKK